MTDLHKNFAYSTVLTAPSPAASGTSLVLAAGGGALMPTVPFNATVWPVSVQPLSSNAEIVRVTVIATDTLTITRTQESTSARTIVVGDQFAATITNKTLTDGDTWTSVETDLGETVNITPRSKQFFFHTETSIQGESATPAGNASLSEWPPDQLDSAGQVAGHLSTSSGAEGYLLNKPTTKDETLVAGATLPTTAPPAAAQQFGWFTDKALTGTFSSGAWIFQWREDDNNAGLAGHPVIQLFASTTRDYAGTMRYLGELHGSTDWWLAATNNVNSWASANLGFTLTAEYLLVLLWCHETSGFVAGQTLTFNTEGSDLANTARSWLLSPPFVQTGSVPRLSGTFDITGTGFITDKQVIIQQATGPYTGKGDRQDEAEMDQVKASAYVANSTTIRAYWTSTGPMKGNVKFNYIVSA